jgi:hypothetical protein
MPTWQCSKEQHFSLSSAPLVHGTAGRDNSTALNPCTEAPAGRSSSAADVVVKKIAVSATSASEARLTSLTSLTSLTNWKYPARNMSTNDRVRALFRAVSNCLEWCTAPESIRDSCSRGTSSLLDRRRPEAASSFKVEMKIPLDLPVAGRRNNTPIKSEVAP